MLPADVREFLEEPHYAVMATINASGTPQLTVMWYALHPTEDIILLNSSGGLLKVKNLRRDPRASFCAVSDSWYGPWLQAEGTASIVSLPDAMEPLIEYYRSLAGEHPDWDDYRAAMERDRRVIVRIELERAGPDRQG